VKDGKFLKKSGVILFLNFIYTKWIQEWFEKLEGNQFTLEQKTAGKCRNKKDSPFLNINKGKSKKHFKKPKVYLKICSKTKAKHTAMAKK
jgi:hypothetical protein